MAFIYLNKVCFGYLLSINNFQIVFRDISVRFDQDQSYGILGVSGSGKSTLLNILTQELKILSGNVTLNNILKSEIVTLPQNVDFLLIHHIKAIDHEFLLRKKDRDDFRKLIAKFSLEHIIKRQTKNLSGGEKQRLALSLLLARRPRCYYLMNPLHL